MRPVSAQDDEPIGSWIVEGQVDGGATFVNLTSLLPGGVAINTAGPGATGHGAWSATGGGDYALTFVLVGWGEDGEALTRGVVRATFALAAGGTLAGPFETEETDAAGAVIETYRGRVLGTRIMATGPLDGS